MTTQATPTKTAAETKTHAYRALLGDIICERYADRETALCHIEVAYEDCLISARNLADLEDEIDRHYPDGECRHTSVLTAHGAYCRDCGETLE